MKLNDIKKLLSGTALLFALAFGFMLFSATDASAQNRDRRDDDRRYDRDNDRYDRDDDDYDRYITGVTEMVIRALGSHINAATRPACAKAVGMHATEDATTITAECTETVTVTETAGATVRRCVEPMPPVITEVIRKV